MKSPSRVGFLSCVAILILAVMSAAGWAQVATPDFQCFPTCSETDARFLSLGGTGLQTTSGFKVTIQLTVPANRNDFEIGVFDGDTGRDEFGNFPPPPPFASATFGHWDEGTDELQYELMADPVGDASGSGGTVALWFGNSPNPGVAGVWSADAPEMPDNDWWNVTVQTSPAIDSLTMIWQGSPATIRVKAWKGSVGSTLLADQIVNVGEELTVNGFAGSPNDVIWEIFDDATGAKIGDSVFHLSCSDDDMNGGEDCGKRQGDGKGQSGFINDWILEGMVDTQTNLNCTAP